MRPWSKRRPHPYRLRVGGVGVMTRPGQDGDMVSRKTRRLDAVAPPTYEYGSLRPYQERPYVMGALTGGMGQSRQQPGTATRYRHALNADLSVAGRRRRGPAAALAAASGAAITGFVEALWGGAPSPMAMTGPDLKVRTGPGAWTTLISIPAPGPTEAFTTARSFKPQAGGWPHRLYLTTSLGGYYAWDGAAPAPTQIVPPAGFFPHFLETVGEELWVGSHDAVMKAVAGADPLLAAGYAAPIPVGDDLGYLTGLGAVATEFYVFRTDGLYTVNADGTYNALTPDLRRHAATAAGADEGVAPPLPGRAPANWRGALWFGYGDQSWRLAPGPVLDLVGLSRLVGNDSPVRGVQTAFAGDDWFGWFAYYDEAANASYLVKHGTWVPAGDESFAFVEVPNGAVLAFPGRRVTALHVTEGAYARNPALLIGFASGEIGEVVLPAAGPDPLLDPLCTYTTEPSEVYWPDHDADAPADLKHWRGVAAAGPHLSATDDLTISYRAGPDDPWTDLAPSLTAGQQRVDTPGTPDQVVTPVLQVKETLGGGGATTPDVESVVLFEQVRPALQLESSVTVVAAEGVTRLDGVRDRRTGQQIRDALRATAGPGPTAVELPDGGRIEADFVDYAERLAPASRSGGPAWDVDLTFVQFRTAG